MSSPALRCSVLSCAAFLTPIFASCRCSSRASPSSSSVGACAISIEIVFSSIIGRVMVVKAIDTVLAPASFGPAGRKVTRPWASISTKTFRSTLKSLSAKVSGRLTALSRSASWVWSSWAVMASRKSSIG